MKFYVKFYLGTPYVGTDTEDVYEYEGEDEKEVKKYIDEDFEAAVTEHANAYEYLAFDWDNDCSSEDDLDDYYYDCFLNSGWEFITKEEYYQFQY